MSGDHLRHFDSRSRSILGIESQTSFAQGDHLRFAFAAIEPGETVGELSTQLSVSAHGFSKTAREKIEASGGTITWLRGEPVARKPKKRRAAKPAEADDDTVDEVAEAEPATDEASDS